MFPFSSFWIIVFGEWFESRDAIKKSQPYRAGRPVSLLADDKFGNTLIGIILSLIVDFISINKTDQVGILFYRA